MVIYLGADHRGFVLKEAVKQYLASQGYEVYDAGAASADPSDDFPKFAVKVANSVAAMPGQARGILLCGSGTGMEIAANKVKGIRAAMALSNEQVLSSRHDDDANVLVIAADYTAEEDAKKYLDVFIKAPFAGEERHLRRLKEIKDIEEGHV